jgi:hypothetical protein
VVVRAHGMAGCIGLLFGLACSVPDDVAPSGGARRIEAKRAVSVRAAGLARRPIPLDVAPAFGEAPLSDRDIDWAKNPVMVRLGHIAETLTHTEYTHGLSVNEHTGVYAFDCSGLVHWVLRRAAPKAAAMTQRGLSGRPLARDYYRSIAILPPGKVRQGWRRIERVEDAEPGDVVAWIKPALIKSPNTGHVAFIAQPPVRVAGDTNAFLIRVIDSTSLLHDDDTRQGGSGFGLGTILLMADAATGAPVEYGWVGLKWRTFATEIAIGRPIR